MLPGLGLHLEQLIAQTRRRLEVEVCRCLTHLRFEIGNQCGNVFLPIVCPGFSDATALLALALFALRARVGDTGDEANLIDALAHADGRDSMLDVVGTLHLTTPPGFFYAPLHGASHSVGVEDRPP